MGRLKHKWLFIYNKSTTGTWIRLLLLLDRKRDHRSIVLLLIDTNIQPLKSKDARTISTVLYTTSIILRVRGQAFTYVNTTTIYLNRY